jgi:CubicO group peptidase (beta-lactamase class C family)
MMKRRLPLFLAAWAGLATAQVPTAHGGHPARPAGGVPSPIAAMPSATPTLNKADLDAWLDGILPYAINTGDVAGAVVTVVKDGAVVTERGYGYSDVTARKPVDPKTTLFRPGSTSKLFTWTAVMQQVEHGKIDLDKDVNTYLDFKIPPFKGKPITMRQIMTHTAGFEEALSGLMAASSTDTPPSLDTVLKKWMPKRVYAPGTTPAYSNYAVMLAGYIVQRVSGEPYDAYIAHHVFGPLGMTHSTMVEPLPANLAPLMSKGYARASQPAKPFEVITFRPAGSATTSADDMTRFMIAHLDPDHNPLMKPQTMRMMHDTPLTILPMVNRMDLGFYEANLNGHRIISHGGDTQWFHSDLWLLPDDRTGIFFSMNSAGAGVTLLTLREALIAKFMDRYYPKGAGPLPSFQPRPGDAALLAGTYGESRASVSGFRKALDFFSQTTITANADGTLHAPGLFFNGLDGGPRDWVEIAPFVWKDRNSEEKLAAQVVDGRVTRLSVDVVSPFETFERVPWYLSTAWLNPVLAISMIGLLGLLLSAPAGWIARRSYAAPRRFVGPERRLYTATTLLGLATLVVLGCWAALVTSLKFQVLGTGTLLLQIATILAMPGFLILAAAFLAKGLTEKRRWPSLLLRGLVVLSAFFLLWGGIVFHLLSFGTDY